MVCCLTVREYKIHHNIKHVRPIIEYMELSGFQAYKQCLQNGQVARYSACIFVLLVTPQKSISHFRSYVIRYKFTVFANTLCIFVKLARHIFVKIKKRDYLMMINLELFQTIHRRLKAETNKPVNNLN